MPNSSLSALAIGARQFVVQEALEMTVCALGVVRRSWLTPITTVTSSFFAGAEMITFLAPPASTWALALVASVKKPVDSMTTSTPRSFHGRLPGSRSARILMVFAADLDAVVGRGDLVGEAAEDRVVLQQVGQRLVVAEVVGGDDLDVGAGGDDGAEEVAADAAEAVDAYANGHGSCSLVRSLVRDGPGATGQCRPYRACWRHELAFDPWPVLDGPASNR